MLDWIHILWTGLLNCVVGCGNGFDSDGVNYRLCDVKTVHGMGNGKRFADNKGCGELLED